MLVKKLLFPISAIDLFVMRSVAPQCFLFLCKLGRHLFQKRQEKRALELVVQSKYIQRYLPIVGIGKLRTTLTI